MGKQDNQGKAVNDHHQGLSIVHIRTLPKVRIVENGSLLELKCQRYERFGKMMVPKRGKIMDFTRKSRQRMQRKLCLIDEGRAGLPAFITLTYPEEYSAEWEVWKKHLNAFSHALVRKWPEVWGVWRLEFQQRGAPHYHFLLWDGPVVKMREVIHMNTGKLMCVPIPGDEDHRNQQVFEWMSNTWFRVVKSGDPKHLLAGTRCEQVMTWGGVVHYASKYLAKLPDGEFCPVDFTGRFWGVIQESLWKRNAIFEQEISEATFYRMRRIITQYLQRLTNSKRPIKEHQGITVFLDSLQSFKLLTWAWGESREGKESRRCPF
jgi:hypothetical protein